MELRPELMPPTLDEALITRLAQLAATLDGALLGTWDEELAEFNQLAGTTMTIDHFQGIYGGEDHEDWVRRVLLEQNTVRVEKITKEELIEIVRRAMPQNEYSGDHEAYMAIFDANVPMERASNLIFYPPDYDADTNTWDDGRPMGEYDPTPEQIVEWALAVEVD